MQNPLILTIDLGTQSVRAMLVDKQGSIIGKTHHTYEQPYYSKNPGWAEQPPDVYWNGVCIVTGRLLEQSSEHIGKIIAVTVTTIRDTSVCVDKDGNALRDVIVWLDKRTASTEASIPIWKSALIGLIGMTDTVELQRSVSACNWIMQNEPEIWDKTYKFLFISAYLNLKLTGRFIDSVASTIGHMPFNSKTRKWMKPGEINRCIFDIEEEKLADVIEPGEELGRITSEASKQTGIPEGLPLIATGSDRGCETLGLSCSTPDKAAIGLGTTATIQITTNRYMEPLPFIPAFPAVMKGHYNPEYMVYRGYWLLKWFAGEFAAGETMQAEKLGKIPEEMLNEHLHEIPPGCEGLVFQPYFTPGVVMPKARGALIGFSDIHTRAHVYRSIIEGINFALMDGLYAMQRRGKLNIQKLFIAGGGARCDEICKITAAMFGLPVYRIQTTEASGLGSSIVAFVSKGVYSTTEEAIDAMVYVKDEFLPDMGEHKVYKQIFDDVFVKLFDKLLPLYHKNER